MAHPTGRCRIDAWKNPFHKNVRSLDNELLIDAPARGIVARCGFLRRGGERRRGSQVGKWPWLAETGGKMGGVGTRDWVGLEIWHTWGGGGADGLGSFFPGAGV